MRVIRLKRKPLAAAEPAGGEAAARRRQAASAIQAMVRRRWADRLTYVSQ